MKVRQMEILISGNSGVGKTEVIHKIRTLLESDGWSVSEIEYLMHAERIIIEKEKLTGGT